jgi:hypothetical protein
MFCSEVIAHLYAHLGYLDTRQTPPESVLPSSFWTSNLAWANGQGLQDAEQLIGDENFIPSFKADMTDSTLVWIEGARTDSIEKHARGLVETLLWS